MNLALPLVVLLPLAAAGQVIIESYSFEAPTLPQAVPDGSASGMTDSRWITSQIATLTDVNVTLTLSNPTAGGAYNGDLFVSLQHADGYAVLLNRVGRREGAGLSEQFGYDDNGFDVTLDDEASNGDVHVYRLQLQPGATHDTPVDPGYVQPLTGTWAPDGRHPLAGDPTISTPRTALLSVFDGQAGSGAWTLFVADLSGGGAVSLDRWSLQFTGAAVPEPEHWAMTAGGALLAWAVWRRHRRGSP